MINILVGSNWGDEGKGKMTDYFAKNADIVVRFQGGNNAGHTIINKYGKFALHLLPSGIFYENVVNILGPGVAFNLSAFIEELDYIKSNINFTPKILISDRAQVLMPYHVLLDVYEEERLGKKQFGSTKSGIAPFYSEKYQKTGIQVSDLYDDKILSEKIDTSIEIKNILFANLYKKPTIDKNEFIPELIENFKKIKPYICNTTKFLNDSIKSGKNIILEGQLGALRDPDNGIYPFSTSSSTLAGFSTVGAGIPIKKINTITTVVKSYSSCVGAGPFVTELFGEEGNELRKRGGDNGEYGAKTGRPRRVGWLDLVATKYGCLLQGATEIALTLIDVLSYLEKIPVCCEYKIDEELTKDFPVTNKLYNAKPVYKYLKGWKCDISNIREYNDLPKEAKTYIEFIEKFIDIDIKWISNGPKRENIIMK
ncbi:MAG: adenylosuccinate synthase [Clostridiales bacterium]